MDTPVDTAAPPEEVLQGVIATLAKCLGEDAAHITPATRLVSDLHVDSLDVLEIVMTLEDDFAVAIPDGAVEHTNITVHQLALIVARYVERSVAP